MGMSGQRTCSQKPNFSSPDKPGIHFTPAPPTPPDGECSGWGRGLACYNGGANGQGYQDWGSSVVCTPGVF